MFIELILVILTVLIVFDYKCRFRRNDILKRSGIPGRRSLPLIGSALYYRGLDSENIIEFMRSTARDHGKIYHSWILNHLIVFCADPKDMEAILTNQVHIRKHQVYDMLRCWLGDGLLLSTGKKWHSRRKIITPSFHFKILEQFIDTFDKRSNVLVEKLKTKADGATVVDIYPLVCLTALDIIAESAMGVEINAQVDSDFSYVKAVQTVTNIVAERMRRPAWRIDAVFRIIAPRTYKTMVENIEIMHKFTDDVIIRRRMALESSDLASMKNSILVEDVNAVGLKKRMALLDVLLQSQIDGKPLSNNDIREEVETFMFEGHDTTTSGICFTLYLISRHSHVQQKLFQEIIAVIGTDQAAPVGHRQLQALKYMECVIKESIRLYPPVPMIGRYLSEDFHLNGKIIPANTQLNIPFFIILRDPDYFSNPDAFQPERFENDSLSQLNPFAYTPFSAGPRNCIGQKYAILEMKSTISKILRYYELLPLGPDVRPSFGLVLRSVSGMNLGLKKRKYSGI